MGVFNITRKVITILFIFIVLFTITNVSAQRDDTSIDDAIEDNQDTSISQDHIDTSTSNDKKYETNKTIKTSTQKHNSKIKVEDINVTYSQKALLKATIIDKTTNKYITSGKALFKVNGITVGSSNIKNGKASMSYDTKSLTAKKYNITVVYAGNTKINSYRSNATLTVKKMPTRLTLNNVNAKTNTSCNIKVLVKDNNGVNVNGGVVVFKINGLSIAKANVKNGVATTNYIPQNKVKNYTITAVYGGTTRYTSSSAKSKLSVTLKINIVNWSSKGNIKSNKVLYNNLTKSSITDELINAARNGTPYVCLGNGEGNCVFIVSGIHGNELSSQSACVRLINELSTMTIHGTVYIFPFIAPSYTGNNTRKLNGVNLNSVANKKGTISNKVYQLAKSKNAISLGDFHCTQPGGKPGRNAVFGTYNPTKSSATLSKYISSKTGSASIIYNKAGTEYPGALEDYCNLNSLTSVTCEVLTPHGSIAKGSVEKSYDMMKAFLEYYKLI